MLRRLHALLFAGLLCVAGIASAHRFHAGLTDISFNARTGSLEVVHTYMAHDVEALLANLYGRRFDLSDPDDQAALRGYVEQQFRLQAQDKSAVRLQWVGMTANPDSVVIYQEAPNTPLSKAALLHNEVMIDFLPDQVNTVNVTENGAVRTLVFQRATLEHKLQ